MEAQSHSSPDIALPEVFWPICERLLAKEAAIKIAYDDVPALTARMVKGDEEAYRDFYDRYFGRMFGYLLVLTRGREDAAKEALQCAMLRVVRYIHRFDNENAFWSWLAVLSKNALIDHERKRSCYRALLERFAQASASDHLPDAEQAESHLIDCLHESVRQLAPEERNLIERKYFERESMAQISAALNVSAKAIESRLTRVRIKLKTLTLGLLRA